MRGRRTCRGFSLLEVLVAFTILAMLLGALFQVFSGGLHAARAGESHTRATVIAQSLLAGLGSEHPLREGATSGSVDETFDWRLIVRPYADEELLMGTGGTGGTGLPRPVRVDVQVSWEEGERPRSVVLTSMRLAPASP